MLSAEFNVNSESEVIPWVHDKLCYRVSGINCLRAEFAHIYIPNIVLHRWYQT